MNKDKIKGMLYGCLLGDAIGAPYEFRKGKNALIDFDGTIKNTIIHNSQFQGKKESALGQITDDSEMTSVLLDSISNLKRYDKTKVTKDYIEWCNSGIPFLGKNTRALFKGIKTLKGYEKRYSDIFSGSSSEWTQSNGCLMRASPLALLPDNERTSVTIIDCKLTNPNPICIEATLIYVELLNTILLNKNIDNYIKKCIKKCKQQQIKDAILDGQKRKKRDITVNKGWILHALYTVFYALSSKNNTYESIISEVINLGGDTDTNGAIVGAVIGSMIGFSEMSKETKTKQNLKIIFDCDTDDGDMKRPQKYKIDNIQKIINKSINVFGNKN